LTINEDCPDYRLENQGNIVLKKDMARVITHFLNAGYVSVALVKQEAQLFSDWILLRKKF
jgi:hypothetical protein